MAASERDNASARPVPASDSSLILPGGKVDIEAIRRAIAQATQNSNESNEHSGMQGVQEEAGVAAATRDDLPCVVFFSSVISRRGWINI